MHAPAAGLIAAELIAGQKPCVDVERLAFKRFAGGKVEEETNVI